MLYLDENECREKTGHAIQNTKYGYLDPVENYTHLSCSQNKSLSTCTP